MNNGSPTFSLAYTSVRPGIIPQIVNLWDSRSKFKNHEWCISVDVGHAEALASARAVQEQYKGSHPVKVVENTGRKNCVDGWNTAAAATAGKVIIAVSDDFNPPSQWDDSLLALEPKGWPDGEHVIHVNDGFIQHIFTLAILTRKRYERFGYLWYPGYESMFCDTEFGDVAKRDGAVIEAMHLLFEHMHHACGKRPKDSADANHENNVRWTRGEMLFNYRKQHGFPVDLGPRSITGGQTNTAHREKSVSALFRLHRLTDCLQQSCENMHDAGIRTFHFAVLSEDEEGHRLTSDGAAGIAGVADKLRQLKDARVLVKVFKLPMYRFPNETPAECDKRLQTDILAWVRADGCSDVISADPCVLWKSAANQQA